LPAIPATHESCPLDIEKPSSRTSINSHLFSSNILKFAKRSRYDNGAGGDATTTAVDGGAGAGGGTGAAAGSAMIPHNNSNFSNVQK
jgi:hypothetical protein